MVTLDGHSFPPTDTETADGSYGDQWKYPTGEELPADLIWGEGQVVTVSVRFPIVGPLLSATSSPDADCPAATTVTIVNNGPSNTPDSLITSASVSGSTLTVEVQAPPLQHHGTAQAEVLEGYKWRVRELKPNRKPWSAWSDAWTTDSTLTRTVDSTTNRFKVEVVACTSRPAPSWMNTDRWYDLDQSNRRRVDR